MFVTNGSEFDELSKHTATQYFLLPSSLYGAIAIHN